MISDLDLQTLPSSSHVQSDGSGIGGVDPVDYGSHLCVGIGNHHELLMYSKGNSQPNANPPAFPAWMLYPTTPRMILPNTGNLSLSYEFSLAGSLFNAFETDTILVTGEKKYNLSGQYLSGTGFEIANEAGDWIPVGFNPIAKLLDSGKHRVKFTYAFNSATGKSSVTSIQMDAAIFQVPLTLQNVPAQPSDWLAGAYLQLQMSSVPAAPYWMARIRDVKFEWS